MRNMMQRGLVIATGAVAGALAGLALLPHASERLAGAIGRDARGPTFDPGPFGLVDHRGRRLTPLDFRGRITLVISGATRDAETTGPALAVLLAAVEAVDPAGDRLAPMFLTADPAHDTIAVLGFYVAGVHRRLIGVTGAPDTVATLLVRWGLAARSAAGKPDPGNLEVSPYLIVIGPDGRLRAPVRLAASPRELARALQALL